LNPFKGVRQPLVKRPPQRESGPDQSALAALFTPAESDAFDFPERREAGRSRAMFIREPQFIVR